MSGAAPGALGAVVVLCPPELPEALPARALPALRAASAVFATAGVSSEIARAAGSSPAPDAASVQARAREQAVVLLAATAEEPPARALAAAGAPVIEQALPPVLRAAAVMDTLRSPGGCPWDGEQTHESLRRYLVEETYELLEAIESGDRAALREELGDVLLQVLFHARLAAEHATDPFDLDTVADTLVAKLVSRHPHVFRDDAGSPHAGTPQDAAQQVGAGTGEPVASAEDQQHRWEELKRAEKSRESLTDGIAFGQPAAALAGKLGHRSARAGLPAELLGNDGGAGARLLMLAAEAGGAGDDPEGALRGAAKEFIAELHAAEAAARAAGHDPTSLTPEQWRRYWPARA